MPNTAEEVYWVYLSRKVCSDSHTEPNWLDMSHHESLSNALRVHAGRRDLVTDTLTPTVFRRAVDAWIGVDTTHLPSSSLLLARIDWEVGFGLPVRPGRADVARALRMVSDLVVGTLRASDLVGRIDDDTIGVLMPSTPCHQATPVCRRIRATVSERTPNLGMPLTVSIGVASPKADDPWSVARQALAQAREEGGDRTVIAHELTSWDEEAAA
jgi:diguanylate cyclase (GGDEF)-like protein